MWAILALLSDPCRPGWRNGKAVHETPGFDVSRRGNDMTDARWFVSEKRRQATAAIGALALMGGSAGGLMTGEAEAIKWPKNHQANQCIIGRVPFDDQAQLSWQNDPNTLFLGVQLPRTDGGSTSGPNSGPNKCARWFYRVVTVQGEEENYNGKGISPVTEKVAFKGDDYVDTLSNPKPLVVHPHSAACLANGKSPIYFTKMIVKVIGQHGQPSYIQTSVGSIYRDRPGEHCKPNPKRATAGHGTPIRNYHPK
jgi:hypothetical protein